MAVDVKMLISAEDRASAALDKIAATGKKTAAEIGGAFQQISSPLSGAIGMLGGFTGGALGLLAGGNLFKSAIDATKEVTGEVVKLSKAMGILPEDASVLRVALDDAFLSVDDAISASDRLTRTTLKNSQAFRDAGIEIKDSNGNLKSSLSIMMEVNDYLKKLKEGKDRDAAAMMLYGKGWRELSGILKLNSEGIKEAEERAKRLHLIIGQEGIDETKKYKLAMKGLDDVGESFKVQVGTKIIKVLTEMAIKFGEAGASAVDFYGKVNEGIESKRKVPSSMFRKLIRTIPTDKELLAMMGGDFYEYRARQNAASQLFNWELGDKSIPAPKKTQPPKPDGRFTPPDPEAAALAAKAQQEYEKYLSRRSDLIKELANKNPDVDPFAKELAALKDTLYKLNIEMPQYSATWDDWGKRMEQTIRYQQGVKVATVDTKVAIDNLEQSIKDSADNFSAMGKSLEPTGGWLQYGKKIKIAVMDGFNSEPMQLVVPVQKFSLTGTSGSYYQEPKNTTVFSETMKEYAETALDTEKLISDATVSGLNKMTDSLTEFVTKGKMDFKGLADSIISDLVRIVIKENITAPLAKSVGGSINWGSIGSWIGGLFKADGGPVSGGQSYIVGERGPELFTPSASGSILPNNALKSIGSGGSTVNVSYSIDARNTDNSVLARIDAAMRAAMQQTKSDILNSMNRGGEFAVASGRIRK